jgi:hypothetical protein
MTLRDDISRYEQGKFNGGFEIYVMPLFVEWDQLVKTIFAV